MHKADTDFTPRISRLRTLPVARIALVPAAMAAFLTLSALPGQAADFIPPQRKPLR